MILTPGQKIFTPGRISLPSDKNILSGHKNAGQGRKVPGRNCPAGKKCRFKPPPVLRTNLTNYGWTDRLLAANDGTEKGPAIYFQRRGASFSCSLGKVG